MKLAILDDWHDSLRSLKCFEKLKNCDVTVFTDHVTDEKNTQQTVARL